MNCKLATLAVLCMASANAFKLPVDFITQIFKSSDSVDIPSNGGDFEFDVAPSATFDVNLAGNPTTGYQWYLTNETELQASSIVLVGKNYAQKKNTEKLVGAGGNFIFSFKANEVCGQELPKLVFAYQRGDEEATRTNVYRLKLSEESCKAALKKDEEVNNTEAKAMDVNNDEIFSVKLNGNPTTGYSWVLMNEEEIASSGVVSKVADDYVEDEHEEGMVGVGGTFTFEFMVNNACGKQLPNLVFGYKRPWEDEVADKAEYTLNLKDDANCAKNVEEAKEVKVKNNETFTLELKGNATTGYKWSLDNEEELAASGVVEKVSEEYVEDEHFFGLVGSGGKFVFTFKVNDACGKELPKLSFVHKQPWNDSEDPYAEKTEYTLILKDSCN